MPCFEQHFPDGYKGEKSRQHFPEKLMLVLTTKTCLSRATSSSSTSPACLHGGFEHRQPNCSHRVGFKKIHLLALSLRSPFFDEVVERRKNKEKGSDIGVRVRRSGYALEISYYRSAFIIQTGGKKIIKSVFIKKSREYN